MTPDKREVIFVSSKIFKGILHAEDKNKIGMMIFKNLSIFIIKLQRNVLHYSFEVRNIL